MRRLCHWLGAFALLVAAIGTISALYALPVADDALVRMPGTQPGQGVTLEAPNRCLNCHSGYNSAVEPGFNWGGSMMAQASRDFLFWACLTVAAQDSMFVLGRPNAVDLCERCHFPSGWIEGRSDPPDVSAMTGADYDGVSCDLCHRMYDPFFETTADGSREGGAPSYWDETNLSGTPSGPAAQETYLEDAAQAGAVTRYSGQPFYLNNLPFSSSYTENASGQYFVSAGAQKRASFADADARHRMYYSRYHKSRFFCSTCHDVSNPALANLAYDGTPPGDGTTVLPTESASAFSYYHVERTFSEFSLSDYGLPGGAPGLGPFDPSVFQTSSQGNNIARCQDCHMRDVVGAGCDMRGAIVRPDGSIEHPRSGQPLHDLTGGNFWVSYVLASAVDGSPNLDGVNFGLLNQGPGVLTLDLTQGQGIDPVALLAGAERAQQQLQLAASIDGLNYDAATGELTFRIQNQTGHKLPSGFPEGRRIFVNVKLYAAGSEIHEVNPYDDAAGTLKGLAAKYPYAEDLPAPADPAGDEEYLDDLVYEMHPSSSITGELEHSFHFVLADDRAKDNRIPPKGFRIGDAAARLAQPVFPAGAGTQEFTGDEYAGGYDEVTLTVPIGGDAVRVSLYYQTTSREYIEFLRNEINGTGHLTLDPAAYIAQTHPFFARLRAWGETIWQLWLHNRTIPGAAPLLMTEATWEASPGNLPGPGCVAPVPTLLDAVPSNRQVTLTWSDEHSEPGSQVVGYRVYYDQVGKTQLVAEVGQTTTYADTRLINGALYCYRVTSLADATGDGQADCESDFSNMLCATPAKPGGKK